MLTLTCILVCEAAFPAVVVVPGQQARQLILTRPAYELEAPFSQVAGIRELSDGRFVVSDGGDMRLMMADPGSGRLSDIPFASGTNDITLLEMAGDSTLIVDGMRSRMIVMGPDGRMHRSFSLTLPGSALPLSARAVDERGRYYAAVSDQAPELASDDSLTVVRFDPRNSKVDTIGRMQPRPQVRSTRRGAGSRAGPQPLPFAAHDTWTVDQDGTLITVRSAGYRLEFSGGSRKPVKGPKTKVPKVKVTAKDKALFKRALLERAAMRTRSDSLPRVVPASSTPDDAIRSAIATIEFPSEMGAFTPATPLVDRLGRVWVQRWVHMDDNETWDVFDKSGRHSLQVELPDERRLVSMGPSGAWVVARGADGVERIERYAVPNV